MTVIRKAWIAIAAVLLAALAGYFSVAGPKTSGEAAGPLSDPARMNVYPFESSVDCFATWPTYDSWLSHARSKLPWWNPRRIVLAHRFPRQLYERARDSTSCRGITYQNDGLTITGWMLSPKAPASGKLPVIVYNRGGNGPFSVITFESLLHNLAPLAESGFIVLASQYRGATGSEPEKYGSDHFGGDDVRDVVRLVELAAEVPGADAENIFMVGASRGAMMTFLALREGAPVRAAAVIAGVADLNEGLRHRPGMEEMYRARIPGYSADPVEVLADRSVVEWADQLPRDVPILVLHGDSDKRVDIHQARLLRTHLEAVGQPHRVAIYEGGDHHLSRHRDEMFREIVAWFTRPDGAQARGRPGERAEAGSLLPSRGASAGGRSPQD